MRLRSGDYLQPQKSSKKLKQDRQLSGIFEDHGTHLMDGRVEIGKDGYYVMQITPPAGTTLTFNDSLLLYADTSAANKRQAIILPLRRGKYPLGVELPAGSSAMVNFGFYYSENGQDDWWRNPIVRW